MQYFGSANRGLGSYHVNVKARENRFRHWASFDNFGGFTIEEGGIDEGGILESLKEQLEEYSYLVRFPPNKKVENVVVGKVSMFYLNRERKCGMEKWIQLGSYLMFGYR